MIFISIYAKEFKLFNNIQIKISGNEFIKDKIIKQQIGNLKNISLLDINLFDIQENINVIDFVESVQISRIFPNNLVVQIIERKPIIITNYNNKHTFIDKSGYIISTSNASINFFPVPTLSIRADNLIFNDVTNQISKLFNFLINQYPIFYNNLSEIIIYDDKWIFFSDKKTKILTSSEKFCNQLNILKYFEKTVYPNKGLYDYSYIDLRSEDQIIVKEKNRKG